MPLYYISILLAILGSATYHLFQKSIPANVHPALVLMATYATAFIGSIGLFAFFPLNGTLREEIGKLTPAAFLPGIAILGIEAGFLLAYRAGWQVNVAPLLINMTVSILLIPIGLILFHEQITPTQLIGVVVCLVGLALIQVK